MIIRQQERETYSKTIKAVLATFLLGALASNQEVLPSSPALAQNSPEPRTDTSLSVDPNLVCFPDQNRKSVFGRRIGINEVATYDTAEGVEFIRDEGAKNIYRVLDSEIKPASLAVSLQEGIDLSGETIPIVVRENCGQGGVRTTIVNARVDRQEDGTISLIFPQPEGSFSLHGIQIK